MCEQTEHACPLGGAVISVQGKNLFEVALYAADNTDIVPGEIPLAKRFRLRFGPAKVDLRKDGPVATVIQITCDPVANSRGLDFFAKMIAAVVAGHYGNQIDVDILMSPAPLCAPRRGMRTTRVPA